jgi:hypothetical protein
MNKFEIQIILKLNKCKFQIKIQNVKKISKSKQILNLNKKWKSKQFFSKSEQKFKIQTNLKSNFFFQNPNKFEIYFFWKYKQIRILELNKFKFHTKIQNPRKILNKIQNINKFKFKFKIWTKILNLKKNSKFEQKFKI